DTTFERRTRQSPPQSIGISQKTKGLSVGHFSPQSYSKNPENGQHSGKMRRHVKQNSETQCQHRTRNHSAKRSAAYMAAHSPTQHYSQSRKQNVGPSGIGREWIHLGIAFYITI